MTFCILQIEMIQVNCTFLFQSTKYVLCIPIFMTALTISTGILSNVFSTVMVKDRFLFNLWYRQRGKFKLGEATYISAYKQGLHKQSSIFSRNVNFVKFPCLT